MKLESNFSSGEARLHDCKTRSNCTVQHLLCFCPDLLQNKRGAGCQATDGAATDAETATNCRHVMYWSAAKP